MLSGYRGYRAFSYFRALVNLVVIGVMGNTKQGFAFVFLAYLGMIYMQAPLTLAYLLFLFSRRCQLSPPLMGKRCRGKPWLSLPSSPCSKLYRPVSRGTATSLASTFENKYPHSVCGDDIRGDTHKTNFENTRQGHKSKRCKRRGRAGSRCRGKPNVGVALLLGHTRKRPIILRLAPIDGVRCPSFHSNPTRRTVCTRGATRGELQLY